MRLLKTTKSLNSIFNLKFFIMHKFKFFIVAFLILIVSCSPDGDVQNEGLKDGWSEAFTELTTQNLISALNYLDATPRQVNLFLESIDYKLDRSASKNCSFSVEGASYEVEHVTSSHSLVTIRTRSGNTSLFVITHEAAEELCALN